MKKIDVWCILVTVLFLLLGLSKVALASSQEFYSLKISDKKR